MNNKVLYETIEATVLQIENDLNIINNTGIYFAPELYIAFSIGKNICKNRQNIFGNINVEWMREIKLDSSGISDIVYKHSDTYTVIELKLRNKIDSYISDIEKLKPLRSDTNKYFCVLADSYSNIHDKRLIALENKYNNVINLVGKKSFKTWSNWNKKQIYCHLNLYSINF